MIDLSIITPAAPGRFDRLESMLKRLELNSKNTKSTFEHIVVDNSPNYEYQELCTKSWPFPTKYIWIPIDYPYPNPCYKRNLGFRIAEGRVFTMIDIDHWVNEHFIEGALEPFEGGKEVLNTGFMIDTSKGSNSCLDMAGHNKWLIENSSTLGFSEATERCGITPKRWSAVWLAAYPGEKVIGMNGYDEKYLGSYGREDDDIYHRLEAQVPVHYDSWDKFSGLHLNHPQGARGQHNFNVEYYNKISPHDFIRNKKHDWGKMISGGFSIMNGKKFDFECHEAFIESLGRKGYKEPWESFSTMRESILKT